MSRRAQDSIRDQLVAAAAAERPRRRRRTAAVVAVTAALLGATAAAHATGILAVGEPIESLVPPRDAEQLSRFRPPHGATVSVTAPDPDRRFGWGVGVYTSATGWTARSRATCWAARSAASATVASTRTGRTSTARAGTWTAWR